MGPNCENTNGSENSEENVQDDMDEHIHIPFEILSKEILHF